jgi:hypothetical protein
MLPTKCFCTAPLDGCSYGATDTENNGCATSCGELACDCPPIMQCMHETSSGMQQLWTPQTRQKRLYKCPLFKCLGLADRCVVEPPAVDENGCTTGSRLIRCDACTNELRTCSDGNTVGRDPKNSRECKLSPEPKCCDLLDQPSSDSDSPGCRGEEFRCTPVGVWMIMCQSLSTPVVAVPTSSCQHRAMERLQRK